LWLLLTGSLASAGLAAGLLVAVAAATLSHPRITLLTGLRLTPVAPLHLLAYLGVFAAALVRANLDVIRSVGVDIRCSTWVGTDITLEELQRDFDAVVLALGLQFGRSTRIPNSDHPQVRKAVSLLRQATAGEACGTPRSAVVIGGGNVAMDIARTLARLQRREYGAARVTVTALEARSHFLADATEVLEAAEEEIEILDARGPRECVVDGAGNLVGLRSWRVKSIFDARGRFAPVYDESDERLHEAEMVVEAIGQVADTALLGEALTERLEWQRGRLRVDGRRRVHQRALAVGRRRHGERPRRGSRRGRRQPGRGRHPCLAGTTGERSVSEHGEGGLHGIDRIRARKTLGEILQVAASFEASAQDFYTGLIPRVSKHIRYLMEELAEEETRHKAELEKLYYETVHSGGV
jgi:hypothetical protein